MSFTRIFNKLSSAGSMRSIGPVRSIYSASDHAEVDHWLYLHNHHTNGHTHHGPLFVRNIHEDHVVHATDHQKQPSQPVEDASHSQEPKFKAWN